MESPNAVEAKKHAQQIREKWLASLVSGEVTLDAVLEFSRGEGRESQYVAALKLSVILKNLPGWNDATSLSSLLKAGLGKNDTIRTLRSAPVKTKKFKEVFDAPPPISGSTRPPMPEGWPWQGKLADLVKVTGQRIPGIEINVVQDESESRSAIPVPGMRANPLTGEIIDPEPFWQAAKEQSDEEFGVTEQDIQELFGDGNSDGVTSEDVEAWLS